MSDYGEFTPINVGCSTPLPVKEQMMELPADRYEKQQFFIRVCRDSGFKLDAVGAADIAARALGCSPLEFWTAVGSLETMDAIASGSHPAAHRS